jgi:hypothetical protein
MLLEIPEDLPRLSMKNFMATVILKELRNRAGMRGYDLIHSYNEIWLFERFCDVSWNFWEPDEKAVLNIGQI